MSSGVTKQQILSMYRVLLREADKFPNYNFRLTCKTALFQSQKSTTSYVFFAGKMKWRNKLHSNQYSLKKAMMVLFDKAYALRRVRDAFRDNKTLTDPKLIKKQYDFATENLAVIKRQVLVGDLYKTEKLVIEN